MRVDLNNFISGPPTCFPMEPAKDDGNWEKDKCNTVDIPIVAQQKLSYDVFYLSGEFCIQSSNTQLLTVTTWTQGAPTTKAVTVWPPRGLSVRSGSTLKPFEETMFGALVATLALVRFPNPNGSWGRSDYSSTFPCPQCPLSTLHSVQSVTLSLALIRRSQRWIHRGL